MKKLVLLALLACAAPSAARIVDGVAAVVDGRVITVRDVETTAAARVKMGAPGQDQRKEALEGLIEKALIQKEAERLGIAVTNEDAEGAAADIRKRNNLDEAAFKEALAAQGMPWSEYLDQLKTQILKIKVAGQVLRSRLRPEESDLKEFYLRHASEFCLPDQVRLRHVEVAAGPVAAEAARRRIEAGETPEAVAREVAGKEFMDMGVLAVGTLSDTVRDAIRNASAQGVSPVVQMGGVCHLFLVSEQKTARVPPYEEIAPEAKEKVLARYYEDKEEELFRGWIDSLKEKAKIELFGS
ncbi:MAG: hypothetical protein HGA98_01565 [Deltaproteobacteria bacterium]|nr:hypothetical protein [Deltaproteobacteria bacterium]